jgi:parallel beta-helix repeat protein
MEHRATLTIVIFILGLRRTSMRRALVLLTVLALSQFGAAVVGAPSVAQPRPACGDTITTDTTLYADLVDCPSNGLVIGADDITLDLNGHTIDGDGALVDPCEDETCDVGVDNGAGHSKVTVVGGTVKEFGFGVLVGGADDNRLGRLTVTDNILSGTLVFDSTHLRITRSTISRNGLDSDFSGIAAFAMRDGVIAHSRIAHNGDIGLYAEGIDGNRITGNRFSGNPEAGLLFDGSGNVLSGNHVIRNGDGIALAGDDNVVRGNHITRALGCPDGCGYGISFEGGSRNVFAWNVISRARWGIRVDAFTGLARGTVVRHNLVRGSAEDNIVIDQERAGTVENTLVARNIVVRAGDDGIDVNSPSTRISGNVAVRNHDLGIEAVAGVTDGGGNHAAANGNPQQCTNVSC